MNSEIKSLKLFNYIGNIFLLQFGLICICSSLLVFYICLTKCDKKATEIRLICIFCIIEIVASVEFILYTLLKLIFGYQISSKGTIMCKFSAFAIIMFPRLTLLIVSILASLRYLIVCHSKQLKLRTWLIILFLANIFIIIYYSIGFYTNDAAPATSYFYCNVFTSQNALSTGMAYFIPFSFIIPCWITTYCYLMVGMTANKRLNIMKQDAINSSDEELLSKIKKQRFKLWIQLLFVFIIYNVNFVLSYVTWVMKFVSNYKRSIIVDAIIVIQLYTTSFLNPIVTILFQPDINNEFKFLWVKLKLKLKSLTSRISR